MGINKKYYWLKLKKDFFTQPKLKKLRKIAGGDTYTIIYLKMQLLSLENDGKLYFESIEDNFIEEIALTIDEDVENVKVTILYLLKQGLLVTEDDYEYTLPETIENIGSETAGAQRVREYRKRDKIKKNNEKALLCNTDVTPMKQIETKCNTEIEIEKEIEKDKELEIEKDIELEKDIYINAQSYSLNTSDPEVISLPLNDNSLYPIYQNSVDEWKELYPAVDILQELRKMKGWLNGNPTRRKTKKGILRFINNWLSREQDKGIVVPKVKSKTSNTADMLNEFYDMAGEWANENA